MSEDRTLAVLLRHGAQRGGDVCAGRRHDPRLSDQGRRRALDARTRLPLTPDLIITSPLRRARETAAVWPGEPIVDERLAERDFGSWEGRRWADLWGAVPKRVTHDPAYAAWTPPGGEAVDAVTARTVQALTETVARAGGARCCSLPTATPSGSR